MATQYTTNLVMYAAGASAILSIFGMAHLYHNFVRANNGNLDNTNSAEEGLNQPTHQQQSQQDSPHSGGRNGHSSREPYAREDVSFPITLELMDKISSREDSQIQFHSACTIQASHPLPPSKHRTYFELKILELPTHTNLSIGLAKKTMDCQMIPGQAEQSLAWDSRTGTLNLSNKNNKLLTSPLKNVNQIAPPLQKGETIGILISPHTPWDSGFIRNGAHDQFIPFAHLDNSIANALHPTLHATGPCRIQFNFGAREFQYTKASLRRYGWVPLAQPSECPPLYVQYSTST